MATTIVRSLGTFGKLPVPFFGNLNLTVNFVTHHLTALPRFAPWGAGAGLGAVWFVWPALTQDFKAGFGIGITLDEEVAQAKAAEEMNKGGEESGKGVDYSATGALKTFATRQGIKNKFDSDEVDEMPRNLDEEAVVAILAAKEEEEGAVPMMESVDALRTFKTRRGAKWEYETEEIDQMPTRVEE